MDKLFQVDPVNRMGFRKIHTQESTIYFFHICRDSSNVLSLSLLEREEHFESDIKGGGNVNVCCSILYVKDIVYLYSSLADQTQTIRLFALFQHN